MKFIGLLLIIFTATCLAEVIELEDADFFKGRVLDNYGNVQGKWFIKFYVPWCPHCQHLAPEWAKMAHSVDDEVNVGGVDCTKHDDLCMFYEVYAYPTIYYIDDSLGMVKYEGRRAAKDLTKYIQNQEYNNEDATNAKDIQKFKQMSDFDKLRGIFGLG
ncbi:unnamed protein product [Moneuplotes crassus]|uniref:Thioredoxin domain-containing protein n=1 Tax=Euplotes crassus TaxID=5936 RepID=A0AAD2D6I2_EUPCR|nr:unnamed protein product [Moneuplotes crassus]